MVSIYKIMLKGVELMNSTIKLVIVACLLLLSACEYIHPTNDVQYKKGTEEKAAAFILDCLTNANPLSDEEPEDWIKNCESFAMNMYGEKVKGFRIWNSLDARYVTDFIPCEEAQTPEEFRACRGSGEHIK